LRNDITNARVTVAFTVDPSGKVSNVRALSSTNRKLERPTLAAVSNWRFEPIKSPREARIEVDFNVQ